MDLSFAPGTIALASIIVLEETGTEFKTTRIDFKRKEQNSDAYLAINPKGRVPALKTDQGTLTETPAILAYLAAQNPKANLAPADPFQFARMQEFNSFLASTVHVNHAHRMRGARWVTHQSSLTDMQAKVAENMHTSMRLIETDYFVGPWVMGDQYTVADAYLFAICSWLAGDGVDINDFPELATHNSAMKSRGAVKRALKRQAA